MKKKIISPPEHDFSLDYLLLIFLKLVSKLTFGRLPVVETKLKSLQDKMNKKNII